MSGLMSRVFAKMYNTAEVQNVTFLISVCCSKLSSRHWIFCYSLKSFIRTNDYCWLLISRSRKKDF